MLQKNCENEIRELSRDQQEMLDEHIDRLNKVFKGKDNYKIAAAVITIIVFCAAFAAVNVFVKKAWIVYTAILMIALLYVFIFRYEIIGGYMQFYNRIADAYYKYF